MAAGGGLEQAEQLGHRSAVYCRAQLFGLLRQLIKRLFIIMMPPVVLGCRSRHRRYRTSRRSADVFEAVIFCQPMDKRGIDDAAGNTALHHNVAIAIVW